MSSTAGSYTWRSKSLDELAEFYREEIRPAMREDGLNPEVEYPSYEWLADSGFRGLEDGLRESHGMTLVEFFTSELGYSLEGSAEAEGGDTGYDWGFDHGPTIREMERYLRRQKSRKSRAESTLRSKRARLAKYARTYERLHGTANLLDPSEGANIGEYETAKYVGQDRADAVFAELEAELSTTRSLRMYYSEINQFYKYLSRWDKVPFNPVKIIPKEFDLETEEADNQGLNAGDVRTLYEAAEDTKEKLIIVGLAAWGLRPNEVAALHEDQLCNMDEGTADDEDDEWPYIEFGGDRKNGPGTVTMLYGVSALNRHIDSHDGDDWNGYIFPSHLSQSGHITTKTVENWFDDIVQRTDVTVGGKTPTPKMGRRFWYTSYQEVMSEVYEQLDVIAEEQGSSSSEVVYENYTDEAARRRMRRDLMQEQLTDAFEGVE